MPLALAAREFYPAGHRPAIRPQVGQIFQVDVRLESLTYVRLESLTYVRLESLTYVRLESLTYVRLESLTYVRQAYRPAATNRKIAK